MTETLPLSNQALVNSRTFSEAVSFLSGCQILAVDTETSKTNCFDDRYLLGIAFYAAGTGYYFPFGHTIDEALPLGENLPIECLEQLAGLLNDDSKTYIFHNAAFDLHVLEKAGVPLSEKARLFDTMIAAHLVNENLFSYALDSVARFWLGEEEGKLAKQLKQVEKAFEGWEKIPPVAMGKYAVQDTKITHDLYYVLAAELEKQGLMPLYEIDSQYVRVLSRVMAEGILIDRQHFAEQERKAHSRMREIEQTLGFAPSRTADLCRSLFLDHSVVPTYGLSKRKTKLFPQGLPITDKVALSRYRLDATSPQVREVLDLTLEYRGIQKAASTYYSNLQARASLNTNLVHAELKQHGTKTGRLSGDMQQIPRDKEKYPVKDGFIAPPGWELWEFDYSQIELRFAVIYAQVASLGQTYIDGGDVHKLTAELIGAYASMDNQSEARQIGKTSNFLLIYLGGPATLQLTIFRDTGMVVSLPQCEAWHYQFHQAYPEFKQTAYRVMSAMESNGFIKYWNGRRRRIERYGNTSSAWNSLIQGGCGQIMKHSMLMLDENKSFQGRMVNQVHDSLWVYLKKDRLEEDSKIVTDTMEWASEKFEFPFPVEGKRIDTRSELQIA